MGGRVKIKIFPIWFIRLSQVTDIPICCFIDKGAIFDTMKFLNLGGPGLKKYYFSIFTFRGLKQPQLSRGSRNICSHPASAALFNSAQFL